MLQETGTIPNYTMFGVHEVAIDLFQYKSLENDKLRYNAVISYFLDDGGKCGDHEKVVMTITDIWSYDPVRCAFITADQIGTLFPVSAYVQIINGDNSPMNQIGYFVLDEVEEEGIVWEEIEPDDTKPRNSNFEIVK